MPDHRRVEQGGRLQGVFLGEVRPDQQLAVLAERLVGEQMASDLVEPVEEELAGLLVPVAEFAHHAFEEESTSASGREP